MSAYKLLVDHFKHGQYINLGLKSQSHDKQDQAFITRLVYESITHYEWMVYQFSHYLRKPVVKEVEIILVMGATQKFLFDGIQDYAIVSEMVNVCKKVKPSYSGLVNAVLKKVVVSEVRNSEDLSIQYSHPQWMVSLFKAQLGEENTLKLLKHNNTQAPLYVRIKQLDVLDDYPIEIVDGSYVASGSILSTDALTSGNVVIQDKASQQVVKMFDDIGNGRVLDACGAPGTKTSQLALMYPQSDITMIDLHEHRVELSKELMVRLGIRNVSCMQADATVYQDMPFDAILCDVPCSGLGVLRRKPDLKRRINPQDLDTLQKLQADILDNMAGLLKVSGQLVYATCTLNRKENEGQVQAFLNRHPEFKLLKERTILPWMNDSDGFYMAQLVKESD